jgi:predicted CoA-substrate-specific enzyme activase
MSDKIGIDVGVVFVKAVRLDRFGSLTASFYEPHRGNPGRVVEEALRALDVKSSERIGLCGSLAQAVADTLGLSVLDLARCQMEGIRHAGLRVRTIIDAGGASATLIALDADGRFENFTANSLCAAGTGSFLDEQAARLGIGYDDMASFSRVENPPAIAARCSVFAKSDLIHRQQEGHSRAAMWSGLCRGMSRTLLSTLLCGRPLDESTALIGGVARNREVLRWIEEAGPGLVHVPPNPHLVAAIGAALLSPETDIRPARAAIAASEPKSDRYDWPLSLERSVYPSFDVAESFADSEQNEVRVAAWPAGSELRAWMGIDVGSTSTKLALVTDDDRVAVDIYRKTAGDPIGATRKLFAALQALAERKGGRLTILGVGTTGSGRKLVGQVIGADAIINEISAHVAGAVRVDPEVETIFEIGGQDSKYMRVHQGHIRDSAMNYVCAAGTGSFVEEQAQKLGYPVSEVGRAVLGRHPRRATDRCTVFMEQDIARLIQQGATAEDALAGVMVSVVKNYLNKVVGNRPISRKRVFFQGATARNVALVAAFERLLGVPVVVSPYCHVMGAYGVALLTRQAMAERGKSASGFRGLDLTRRNISLTTETCDLCQNHCRITRAEIENCSEHPSWGYMCGRDPEEARVRVNPAERALRLYQRLWREGGAGIDVPAAAPVVVIPRALSAFSYLPLWRRFFNRLGFSVRVNPETGPAQREKGARVAGAEFCFPAKVAIGHVATALADGDADWVLVPHMVSARPDESCTASKFCPYVQSLPAYARTSLAENRIDSSRMLSPVVDLRLRPSRQVKLLAASLGGPLGRTARQIAAAWKDALQAQADFERRCREEGERLIEEARQNGEKIIVLLGRPYNNHDGGINLRLPQKIAEHGRTVLPLSMFPHSTRELLPEYRNLYWNYGQKILASLKRIARDDDLDAVILSNFGCGPDSFLLSYAEQIMGAKPFLTLELDEHGADAGYLTRIEAFFDVLRRGAKARPVARPFRPEPSSFFDRRIWIPPMHPLGAPFFAAAFRRAGFDALAMPTEDSETFELGRSLTRGSECLPTALTIGAFVKAASRDRGRRPALFMPTAEGPCRFGQYCTLHRQILDREGFEDAAILSPSSFNSYQGLPEGLRRHMWLALLAADLIFKALLKTRPYELEPGTCARILAEERERLERALERGDDVFEATRQAVARFAAVPRRREPKPLVGIVGEIYVRCDPFANEDVIGAIERFGGEAWLAPMSEWILYTAATQEISFWDRSRNPLKKLLADAKNRYLFRQEHRMLAAAGEYLADRREPDIFRVIKEGRRLLPPQFEGESILTLGRTACFAEQGAALVANCAPFGCMPGTITTAIFRRLSREMGLPVVSLFYDGHSNQNRRLEVFLQNAAPPARRREGHGRMEPARPEERA